MLFFKAQRFQVDVVLAAALRVFELLVVAPALRVVRVLDDLNSNKVDGNAKVDRRRAKTQYLRWLLSRRMGSKNIGASTGRHDVRTRSAAYDVRPVSMQRTFVLNSGNLQ